MFSTILWSPCGARHKMTPVRTQHLIQKEEDYKKIEKITMIILKNSMKNMKKMALNKENKCKNIKNNIRARTRELRQHG